MLRYGIVGCGAIYGTHVDAIKGIDGATVSGFYDTNCEKATEAADKYGAPAAKSLEDLFKNSDVVSVCVPSGLHAEVGIKAAAAGKHLIVEKPIDINLAAAQSLVDSCKQNGVKLACISQHRFSSAIRDLHDAAQGGDFGKLIEGDAYIKWYRTQAYYDSGDWRGTWALDGGGCLINQGVHYIDMIQWIMGGVKSVQAQVRTASHDIEVEDVAAALIEYKNGATGVIQGSTSCYPGLAERLEVHGQHGSVIIEGDRKKLWKIDPVAAQEGKYGAGVMQQPTPSLHLHDSIEEPGGASDPTAIWGEQHRLQIEDFTRAVVDGTEPYMTGEMALEPLRVILSIYESSQTNGARVRL